MQADQINENEMKLEFDARSVNEGFARMAVAAFVAELNPTLDEISDIKTAVSEAVTNAIRHANSTEVYIKIKGDTEHTKMTIRNNGKKPKAEIIENEGIKGMRRKIAQIGGKIEIITKPEFLINIEI